MRTMEGRSNGVIEKTDLHRRYTGDVFNAPNQSEVTGTSLDQLTGEHPNWNSNYGEERRTHYLSPAPQ